jgi:PhnB protein
MSGQPGHIRSAVPYLIVAGAADAIDFYRTAFGATEVDRMTYDDGRIGHAELTIGGSRLFLADEFPESGEGIIGPASLGGSPVIIDLDVDDVEAVVEEAVRAGATIIRPVGHPDQGIQSAKLRDPFGHIWLLTRVVG